MTDRRRGALRVFGLVFWWGFALPVGTPLGVLAVVLVLAGWPALRR